MSSILNCPACHGELALPAGRLKRIECPHCQQELLLAAAVANAAEASQQRLLIAPAARSSRDAAEELPSAAAYRNRKAKQSHHPSLLGQMIGILAGGLLGTLMGYWLLNYFGGPRYDFLGIRLPLVPHTQVAAPRSAEPPPAAHSGPLRAEPTSPPLATIDHAASPPASSSELSSLPIRPPSPARPLSDDPQYTVDTLRLALAAAHAAVGCEHCQSTGFVKKAVVMGVSEVNGKRIERKAEERQPCGVCGGKPTGRINAEAYEKLCRLSQVVTYIKAEPDDAQIPQHQEDVEQVFLRAAADREKQAALGRLATHHLANRGRKVNGVLLAGTVQETGQSGDYFWLRLLLFGLPQEVVVVSRTPARAKPQDRLLVAGSIVDEPLTRLPDYTAGASQVVWGGLPILLPAER